MLLFGGVCQWAPEANGGTGGVDRTAKVVRVAGAAEDKARRQRWLRVFAGQYLRTRVQELAAKHGFRFDRCFVLSQRTRWDSRSKKRNVSLNWRLVSAPEYAIDYVILHELVHTRVMDHSHRFWVTLRAVCPDTTRAVAWLNANRPKLELRRGAGASQAKQAEESVSRDTRSHRISTGGLGSECRLDQPQQHLR